MNCREASDMILRGDRSDALEQHLGACPECRSLDEDLRRISGLAQMPLPEVPEKLDRAVLACAAEQTARKSRGPGLLFRMPVLRAAAAVAVLAACAALTLSTMIDGRSGTVSVSPHREIRAAATGKSGEVMDFLTDSAELDADLLTLSVELDNTESDLLLMASASTPSWLSGGSTFDF